MLIDAKEEFKTKAKFLSEFVSVVRMLEDAETEAGRRALGEALIDMYTSLLWTATIITKSK